MKSKSFQIKESPVEKSKLNQTYDFVGLYQSAADTNAKLSEKKTSGSNVITENSYHSKAIGDTPKRERSPNKKSKKSNNESVEVSRILIDGQSLGPKYTSTPGRSSPVSDPRVITTGNSKVKSIMKNSSSNDDAMDGSGVDVFTYKSKKRNKSVSFMLEDHEEVAIKKTKSEDSIKVDAKLDKKTSKRNKIEMKKNFKKLKKNLKEAEKENKKNNIETDQVNGQVQEKKSNVKTNKEKPETHEDSGKASSGTETALNEQVEKKKKIKKNKKRKQIDDSSEPTENESNNNDQVEPKNKKLKKKKRNVKIQVSDTTETEGEPAVKSRKKEPKADVIAEDLENLSIGDNAHTLTNLLDEMTVVDKDKKKKNKVKRKKGKGKTASASSSETADLEKIEEGKEKVKWKKRKWNKGRKDADDNLENMVIIDNLPLSLMLTYKKVLAEHFGKLGLVKKIGIAEVYPTEESKPVFTTTIIFNSDGAANKALEEDNTELFGTRIRVRTHLPSTLTTLVVRSYGELTEQAICSVFSGAGRIRNIRILVKSKKSMATSFIEFDGPKAVERAIKMAEDAKIGGKKIHVSKFEQRSSKRDAKKDKNNAESENEGDSEDSND